MNEVPFMKIKDACKATGVSQFALRKGCIDGTIPHVMSGKVYLINVPALRRLLDEKSNRGGEVYERV